MLQKLQKVGKSKTFSWFRTIVSTLIIAYLISKIDFSQTLTTLKSANIWMIFAAVLITFPTMAVRMYKWHTLIPSHHYIPLKDNMYMYGVGVLFSSFTPAKIGDLIRMRYLISWGLSKKNALFFTLLDRVFDLLGISTFAVFAWWFHASLLIVTVLCAVIILVGILIFSRILNTNQLSKIHLKLGSLLQHISDLPWYKFWLMSIVISFFLGLQTWLILTAFSQSVSLIYVITTVTAGAIIGLIPFSFSGYGIREGFITWMFTVIGVPIEIAIFTAFFYIFISLILPAIVFGMYYTVYDSYYAQRAISLSDH